MRQPTGRPRGRPRKVREGENGVAIPPVKAEETGTALEVAEVKPEKKAKTKALAISKAEPTEEAKQNAALAMDKADEWAILASDRGDVAGALVYEFPDRRSGKSVRGLTIGGVREVFSYLYKKLPSFTDAPQFSEKVIDKVGKVIECLVKLTNPKTGEVSWGFAESAETQYRQDGTSSYNPFAKVMALNKAERNAMRKQIPEAHAVRLIAQWLRDKTKVQVVDVAQATPQSAQADNSRTLLIRRIFGYASGAVDVSKDATRELLIRAVEKIYKKRISEMNETELQTVAKDIKESAERNPAQFKAQIEREGA